MSSHDPTPEMVAFYETRTHAHIERVRKCLSVMASVTGYAAELQQRALVHDASKYSPEERIPYIWLTEFHRCRRSGEPFSYPDGMKERVEHAVDHHTTTNRHHAEFHADPNDMTDVDLIEMVCDWTAMAQEFDQDNGSAREWAKNTIGQRLMLNDDRRAFVFRMIDLLDSNLALGSIRIRSPLHVRIAACIGETKDWDFFIINDNDYSLDRVLLRTVEHEWGDTSRISRPDAEIRDLASGEHALLWEEDDFEFRISLQLLMKAGAIEQSAEVRFGYLYRRVSEMVLLDELGRRGCVEVLEFTQS